MKMIVAFRLSERAFVFAGWTEVHPADACFRGAKDDNTPVLRERVGLLRYILFAATPVIIDGYH